MRPPISSVTFSLAEPLYQKVNEYSKTHGFLGRLGGVVVVVIDMINDPLAFGAATIAYLGCSVLNILGCCILHSKCSLEDALISLEYSASCLGKAVAAVALTLIPLKPIVQLYAVLDDPTSATFWKKESILDESAIKRSYNISLYDETWYDQRLSRFQSIHKQYNTNPYSARFRGVTTAVNDIVLGLMRDLRMIARTTETLLECGFKLPVSICLSLIKVCIQTVKVLYDPTATTFWGRNAEEQVLEEIESNSPLYQEQVLSPTELEFGRSEDEGNQKVGSFRPKRSQSPASPLAPSVVRINDSRITRRPMHIKTGHAGDASPPTTFLGLIQAANQQGSVQSL